jgi:hypothetical protein
LPLTENQVLEESDESLLLMLEKKIDLLENIDLNTNHLLHAANYDGIANTDQSPTLIATTVQASKKCIQDWDDALDLSVFFGRHDELKLLENWILQDQCRLITNNSRCS